MSINTKFMEELRIISEVNIPDDVIQTCFYSLCRNIKGQIELGISRRRVSLREFKVHVYLRSSLHWYFNNIGILHWPAKKSEEIIFNAQLAFLLLNTNRKQFIPITTSFKKNMTKVWKSKKRLFIGCVYAEVNWKIHSLREVFLEEPFSLLCTISRFRNVSS